MRTSISSRFFALILAASAPALAAAEETVAPSPPPPVETLRSWVQEMKELPRGPFLRIRWFCKDGEILEPEPYACEDHGGGFQHGEWTDKTKKIREAGYPIANVLAELKPEDVIGPKTDPEFLRILLLEKFLIAFDDGWILRKAQFYRGAFQDYNEKDAATAILLAMLGDPVWRQRFAVLREAVRLLPHGAETALITEVRGGATTIADQDPLFAGLRAKIHISPDASDAQRVRDYAVSPKAKKELQGDYTKLAMLIDEAYNNKDLIPALESLTKRVRKPELAQKLLEISKQLRANTDADSQFKLSSDLLALIRDRLLDLGTPSVRLAALDVSLNAEITVFTASRALQQSMPHATRSQRLAWMGLAARAFYGLGLLTGREFNEINNSLKRLAQPNVKLGLYRSELQLLERAPGWGARRLAYYFSGAIDKLLPIEPVADMYVPDRLRSSPMLFYSSVLESLAEDANRLSGTRQSVFGRNVDANLRRLNPGIARGILRSTDEIPSIPSGSPPAIFLVPETTSDLPPAAGILTAEEGNALSHVQLLARNLGIPNVVVGRDLMPAMQSHRGKPIVVAASPGGVVRIEDDGPSWDKILGSGKAGGGPPRIAIHIDLNKLDLKTQDFIPTSKLGAKDSGRIVGPKAAQVGELAKHFPDNSSPGLAIPFGVFRALLDRPREAGKPQSMFAWMQVQYDEMQALQAKDPAAYDKRVKEFLETVRNWIRAAELGADFKNRLHEAMKANFGEDGSYGVFVRSDTNIEDLPGFTGAGLNKTIPNVVGFDSVLKAIKEVWSSPFTERAFGWRQGLMDQPEHVYASVLLHRSVPNEKSGVMITADVDSGDRNYLTVVANAGVGGGVDGQAAETLRIALKTGEVQLLASATARMRRILPLEGGSKLVPAPAPDTLLQPEEIAQLVALANALPQQYPQLLDAEGKPAPADIEFGFVKGHLMLLQIRPFLQNQSAQRNQYLIGLDAGLRDQEGKIVDLRQMPVGATPP